MLPFPVMPCTHVPAHPVQKLVRTAIYHIRFFFVLLVGIEYVNNIYCSLIRTVTVCGPTCYFILYNNL